MVTDGLAMLCWTAASIGFVHTILGPDHYLPFVAMARVGKWSLRKTLIITLLCGLGHVLSSVVVGFVGIGAGAALLTIEALEGARGSLAGWMMLAFGLVYFVWGVRRAIRNRPHSHFHVHDDGTTHHHEHVHAEEHLHVHAAVPGGGEHDGTPHDDGRSQARPGEWHGHAQRGHVGHSEEAKPGASLTPWVLFTIFLFGPCEPLIPFLMYPAAQGDRWGVALVAGVFGVTTLATMAAVVTLALMGVGSVRFARAERYGHAVAGFVVLACGAAIKVGL